jgi:hypothetical protein
VRQLVARLRTRAHHHDEPGFDDDNDDQLVELR